MCAGLNCLSQEVFGVGQSVLTKIEKLYPKMSKGHRKIADFILSRYDRAAL